MAKEAPPNLPKGEASDSPSFGGGGEVKEIKPGYITANPDTYRLIKEVRNSLKANPTEAEKVLWKYVRNKKTGHKIRRQHIIDNFITDFVCLSKKLVIEVDGKIHEQQNEHDELRTLKFKDMGYQVIRFKNEEVFKNPKKVTEEIKQVLDNIKHTEESPSFGGGGEVDN